MQNIKTSQVVNEKSKRVRKGSIYNKEFVYVGYFLRGETEYLGPSAKTNDLKQ